MKTVITALCLFFSALSVSAATLYEQLCTYNFNWEKYALQAPAGQAQNFPSDREYIQAHLTSVLTILRSAPVGDLSNEQQTSRAHMIALLDGYRIAGNFPQNYYRLERIPVFIDEHGTHCAVGYLMMKTGEEAMAQRISKADNYVWVKDIHDPALAAWQGASGLSVEDLKLIQGAYDSYLDHAFYLPNRYETPQMPICTTAYFTDNPYAQVVNKSKDNVWCKGEGANGVLNGRWEQNYGPGLPWIVGYYENGKRTGNWEEYYQGTKKLCRTEQWKDHKLNGIRRRFDMEGNLIEKIVFKEGKATCKTNYDRNDSLIYVRVPLDSVNVFTQVMNFNGELIASGHETIYNPGNLQWFQNIELTALNSASIRASSVSNGDNGGLNTVGGITGNNLYMQPQLVQYKKQGDWIYYQDLSQQYASLRENPSTAALSVLSNQYKHYGKTLSEAVAMFPGVNMNVYYDSIRVTYKNNQLQDFVGYSSKDFLHLYVDYYDGSQAIAILPYAYSGWRPHWSAYYTAYSGYDIYGQPVLQVRTVGQYNREGQRIGEWKYYTAAGAMYKIENYLIPTNEAELAITR